MSWTAREQGGQHTECSAHELGPPSAGWDSGWCPPHEDGQHAAHAASRGGTRSPNACTCHACACRTAWAAGRQAPCGNVTAPPATSPGPDRDTRTHGMQPANQYLRARMFERSTHWQCPPRRSKQGVEMQATHSSQPVLNQSIKCWHVLRFAAFHSRAMSTPKKKALGWYSSANCTPIECSTSATLFCGVERRESERRGDGSGTSAPQPQCSAVFEHPQPTVLPYACESSALASATRACGATAPCLSHAPRPAAGRTCRRDVVVSRACHSASHRGTTRGGR